MVLFCPDPWKQQSTQSQRGLGPVGSLGANASRSMAAPWRRVQRHFSQNPPWSTAAGQCLSFFIILSLSYLCCDVIGCTFCQITWYSSAQLNLTSSMVVDCLLCSPSALLDLMIFPNNTASKVLMVNVSYLFWWRTDKGSLQSNQFLRMMICPNTVSQNTLMMPQRDLSFPSETLIQL